jgi:catalase (peroxidase I)
VQVREKFGRMGFNDRSIVALIGAVRSRVANAQIVPLPDPCI